ncbi:MULTISPECIES: DUF6252 family protein [Flavobacterium]|uniref:DUF6252 family protein n=1 Tax=Flavobacterium jumunjinense TaxID=998845 RepID=A0ABV5GKZ1_9FLAO|nr:MULTISPECIES: DUF6252 family protein [Flavobacterium]
MKKIVIVLLGMFLLTSCVNETEDNTPTIQARLNGVSWKAKETNVSVDAGGALIIKGYRGSEVLTIKLSAPIISGFPLGTENMLNFGTYTVGSALSINEYTTGIVPGPVYEYLKENAGTGYSLNNSAMTTNITTTSNGAGLVFKITEVSPVGAITKLELKARGANYKAGEIVTVQGGNGDARFKISNVQQSNGKVVVSKIENGTITGTFQLNAVNDSGDVVTFSEGVFYKVPMN